MLTLKALTSFSYLGETCCLRHYHGDIDEEDD
jgi:hypothetical protein